MSERSNAEDEIRKGSPGLDEWLASGLPLEGDDATEIAHPSDDLDWGRESGQALVARARTTPFWTITYRAGDDGDLARDGQFHLRRMAHLMNDGRDANPSVGANRLGQYVASMRRAMGRSVVELASDASGAIDPVAVVLMEHGRLSDEELNVNLLSGVATALRMPVSMLREIRDGGTAVQSVAGEGVSAGGTTGLLHRILVSLGPITRPMANVLGSSTAAPSTADLDLHVLERPVLLVSFRADVSDGRVLEVTPVLEPDHDRTPGYSTLVVRVHDASGNPVVGLRIRLDLLQIEGLEDEEPVSTTGADGVARFSRVPLSRFVELDDEGVRATGADQAYPVTLLD